MKRVLTNENGKTISERVRQFCVIQRKCYEQELSVKLYSVIQSSYVFNNVWSCDDGHIKELDFLLGKRLC